MESRCSTGRPRRTAPFRRRNGAGWGCAALLAAAFLAGAGCATPPELAPPPPEPFVTRRVKPTVAVSSFENRSGFEGQWTIGDGLADLLVAALKTSGRYEVLERQNLQPIIGELNRRHDPRFRPEGQAVPGQLKHCRYLIRGVIDDFSHVGGGTLAVALRRLVLFGRGYVARVTLTLTVVDVETGVIVATVAGAGRAYARELGVEGEYRQVRFGAEAFYKTPLGRATRAAIREAVDRLLRQIPVWYWQPMIAAVEADGLILNGGAGEGFVPGRLYQARRRAEPVTDPGTGDLLTWLPGALVGTVRVVEVRERISLAEPVNGRDFERGLFLEPVPEPGELTP